MSQATQQIFNIKSRPVGRQNVPVAAATKIWAGTLCSTDASGNLIEGNDTAAQIFYGQAADNVDNSGGAAGDLECAVYPPTLDQNQFLQIPCTSPDQTWIQKLVYLSSNQSVALSASVTNHIVVGRVFTVDATGVNGLVTVNTADRSTLAASGN